MRAHHPKAFRSAAGVAAVALVVLTGPEATAAPSPRPAVTSSAAATAAFRPSDARLAGPVGLVAGVLHPDVWWTLGSGGGTPRLFALGSDGRTRASYTLTGAAGGHPNALAIVKNGSGEPGLFLGDLSQGRTGSLTLQRVAEPASLSDGALPAKSFRFSYPDGGHDGGTLLADPAESRIYVVTRGPTAAAVFAMPGVFGPQTNALTRLRTLAFPVRGGGFTPDGKVVLRTVTDVRVLGGIRDGVSQVIRTSTRAAGEEAFGVAADGHSVLMADPGTRPMFRTIALSGADTGSATGTGAVTGQPQPGSKMPLTDQGSPMSYPSESGPPGGLIGTGALVGLALLGVLSAVLYLRGRRQG